MLRRWLLALALVTGAFLLTACTPDEVRAALHLGRAHPGMACGQWVGTARQAGFQEGELEQLGRIMRRESRCQPTAVGPTDDWGLTQIHAPAHLARLCREGIACTRAALLDPLVNLRAAREVYLRAGGWSPWRPVP